VARSGQHEEIAFVVRTELDEDRRTPMSGVRFARIESERLILRRFKDSDLSLSWPTATTQR
jgi:hypothetical protein